jgi:ABC-type sulfate/molybdate transport systems ATPase subunit
VSAGAPPKLVLSGIRVRRGSRTVLHIDRLEIPTGEVIAVLGPNGAGKSTLLQICGFLLRPDEGTVSLDGRAVSGTPLSVRRRATLLLQSPLLLDRRVLANVELGLQLRGVPGRERRGRALEWLERFGVAELAERHARTLSGGEAQRVALARALAFEPEIALLDEPFTALDQPTRESLVGASMAELRRLGCTTIFVTHDRTEAARFADRLLVLIGGEIRQQGTPADVQARPIDETVRAYVLGGGCDAQYQ